MKTIDITTTQNVTIEYELAEVRDRVFAFLLDVIIIFVFNAIISIFARGSDNLFWGIVGLCATLYFLLAPMLMNGQTIGKRALGIRIVRIDGQRVGATEYLIRFFFYLLEVVFCSGVVATVLVATSKYRQRLGGITTNTTVIKDKFDFRFRLEDILKISTIEDYEPQYPEIKRFTEKDMLMIKSALTRCNQYRNVNHNRAMRALVKKIATQLDIKHPPKDHRTFLRTLLRDYIVLTR